MATHVCGIMNLRGAPCVAPVAAAGDRCDQHVGMASSPAQSGCSTLNDVLRMFRNGRREAWFREAVCRSLSKAEKALFYSHSSDQEEQKAIEQKAKGFCHQCPSMEACLQYALQTRQDHGIWGGTTESERLQLLHSPGGQKRKAS